MVRSVVAVLAGVVVWSVLALGADAFLMQFLPGAFGPAGQVSEPALLGVTLLYSLAFGVVAGYFTARLAPDPQQKHVWTLATLMVLLTLASTVQFFATAPVWYHAAMLLLLAPAVLLGGRVCTTRRTAAAALAV
jgi:hypothetical protein